MPVPSPEKGGGLGVGLAAPPCKKTQVTKTSTRNHSDRSELGVDGSPVGERMALSSESRIPEAAGPMAVISSRAKTFIGTWNVRTMYETGKSRLIAAEMKKYKINILGICESRWTGSGQVVLYSGYEEDGAPHTQEVAFMLSGPAQRALIGWEAHGPRIIIASFRTTKKIVNIDVIQCYAPTNDADEEEKVNFYQQLQTLVQRRSRRNIMLLMGDLPNGSIFQHRRIHKATWIKMDGQWPSSAVFRLRRRWSTTHSGGRFYAVWSSPESPHRVRSIWSSDHHRLI